MDEPILSVDDLIFKIGTLVVEKMELEKKLANIVKIEEEYKGVITREQDLRRQLEDLAKKYNEVVEQLNQERMKVKQLEGKLNAYGNKGKKRNKSSDR
jgi:peptidoglycan hydrolase CwlO-like protein